MSPAVRHLTLSSRRCYEEIAGAVVAESVIETARREPRGRTRTPEIARAGRQRVRLTTRLEQLKKQHGWGDIGDDE